MPIVTTISNYILRSDTGSEPIGIQDHANMYIESNTNAKSLLNAEYWVILSDHDSLSTVLLNGAIQSCNQGNANHSSHAKQGVINRKMEYRLNAMTF